MRESMVIDDLTLPESRDSEAALSGMDENEFRAFYDRTARPLWVYLLRITGSRHEADDVLQEAYYRFVRGARQYESEAHRRNSLFRIATNVARDAARHAKLHKIVPLENDESRVGPVQERQTALRADLARGFEQLEPLQREMLWLAYAQGASHEEIAGILSLRTVSIRTMLLRARRKLAAILTGEPRR